MRQNALIILWVITLLLVAFTAWLPMACAAEPLWTGSGRFDLDSSVNLSGGLQSRAASAALFEYGGVFDTAAAGWWPGGSLELSIEGVRADGNLPARTGAVQLSSNEWAPNFLRIYQLTYRQVVGPTSVRVGVMDLSQYFETSDQSALLHNSSFGLAPTLMANVNVPTFPNPGLGAMGEVHLSKDWQARAAIWQGNPPALNGALHEGSLVIAEAERDWTQAGQDEPVSDVKVGVWRYEQSDPSIGPTTAGGYLVGETRWHVNQQQWGAFVLAGTAPASANIVRQFLAGGVLITGLLSSRPQDQFSAGVTRVNLHAPHPETVIEAVYSLQLTQAVALQPDLQRFWHPGSSHPNVWVAGMRVHWGF